MKHFHFISSHDPQATLCLAMLLSYGLQMCGKLFGNRISIFGLFRSDLIEHVCRVVCNVIRIFSFLLNVLFIAKAISGLAEQVLNLDDTIWHRESFLSKF